jgi:ClpP class serine protease
LDAIAPFKDLTEANKARLEFLARDCYDRFVSHVESTRGKHFKSSRSERDETIYSSDVFLGQKALDLG